MLACKSPFLIPQITSEINCQKKKITNNSRGTLQTEVKVINILFIAVLRVILKMSSKSASVNPLALFLKPQSPAERLAAQQWDCEKLQRERQLKELQEEAKARGEAGKRPVGRLRGSKDKPPPLSAPSGASIQSECRWQVCKRKFLL